jgi:hypothetical protein
MPADQPNIGMGRRRQGDTEPERSDDRNRSLDRAIDGERLDDENDAYDSGKVAGADGTDAPHQDVKPGTRSDITDAKPDRERSS